MAPLSEALRVIEVEDGGNGGGNESKWGGQIDGDWTSFFLPNGGYSLGLIIESCIAHQKKHFPALLDPIHVSAHYLRPTQAFIIADDKGPKMPKQPAPFEVHVKTVKFGKTMCNIEAKMVQSGQTTISTHLIFGLLPPSETTSSEFIEPKALKPPSSYARRTPLRTHPSDALSTPLHAEWNFKKYISGKEDKILTNMNRPENRKLSSHGTTGFGAEATGLDRQREPPGLEFGAYLTLKGEERLHPSMLAFCADVVKPLPELLPLEENPLQGKTWYATLTLSIEFKTPLLLYDFDSRQSFSPDTVGLYSSGRFLQDPLGRHDTYVEIWTAPNGGGKDADWREKQRCLAVATQTAICVPYEKQMRSIKARV